jgi:hypothetical protein
MAAFGVGQDVSRITPEGEIARIKTRSGTEKDYEAAIAKAAKLAPIPGFHGFELHRSMEGRSIIGSWHAGILLKLRHAHAPFAREAGFVAGALNVSLAHLFRRYPLCSRREAAERCVADFGRMTGCGQ